MDLPPLEGVSTSGHRLVEVKTSRVRCTAPRGPVMASGVMGRTGASQGVLIHHFQVGLYLLPLSSFFFSMYICEFMEKID